MELALNLGLETAHSGVKHGITHTAGSRRLPLTISRWRRQRQPRRAHVPAILSPAAESSENTWIKDSDFANRPPIETPDDLIFPVCVFCGYGRSYEPEFGIFNPMSCEADIYCHEGCAMEDLMLDERDRERSAK
jgi:hypothetical protein